ncbi:MAG: DMT family transporter [Bacteroidales bacterium]|nr:DMT family transporter [Bacteroidales bacterium]
MKSQPFKPNILLLTAALIWGFAFVAQRKGMEHIHPLTFNGIRFLLGAVVLLPFLTSSKRKKATASWSNKRLWFHGILAGFALFVAASFQQLGIVYTTAGKAGFITSLYILFVPAFGMITGHRSGRSVWLAALLATAGLYLLSVHEQIELSIGDILVLISALFWAMHLIVLSYIAPLHDAKWIAFIQFLFTGLLSLLLAIGLESPNLSAILQTAYPLLYAGIMSAGIGFTLQIAAQGRARADHAAIILSLEAVFAAIGGYIILGEKMNITQLTGCLLMLIAVVWIQLKPSEVKRT